MWDLDYSLILKYYYYYLYWLLSLSIGSKEMALTTKINYYIINN